MGKIILTGDYLTEQLHVGHYVSSLERRMELQSSGELDEIYVMIADTQALADNVDNPEKARQNMIEMTPDYLACGLGPEKSVLFIQSQAPELYEMAFYYMDLVTVFRLQRSPTVEPEIQICSFEASISVGFFTYPISQAADIIAFKATTVPVEEDQAPMIGQTKEIVHKFNSVYGKTLVEPDILLPDNKACLRLPGINGKVKISKSLGNCVHLPDSKDEIKEKIMSIFMGPNHLKVEDPGQVEGNPVFIYLDAFYRDKRFEKYLPDYKNLDELETHYTGDGSSDVKVGRLLNNVLQNELRSIHERHREIAKDTLAIYRILEEGSRKAEQKVAQALAEMKRVMKINYFEDKGLIAEQAEWFRTEME